MTDHRMRIMGHVAERLRQHHLAPGKNQEAISLALGHAYVDKEGAMTVVLADPDAVFLFAEDCYEARGRGYAILSREVRAGVYWEAIRRGYTAVVDVHDHHFADQAVFSAVDDTDDERTGHFFREQVPQHLGPGAHLYAAALLLARRDWAARIVWAGGLSPRAAPMRIDEVGLADRQLSRAAALRPQDLYSRQQGVLKPPVQARLQRLHAVVVGCGGTGSIMAETLGRLGFGRLTLIDADLLEPSNLNRFQGGEPRDIGRPKAGIVATRLRAMMPSLSIEAVEQQSFSPAAAAALETADVMVGCVDNAETRWWLNRFAVQYMVPWFDCGVLIETAPALVMHTRVHAIVPGAGPCGHCTPMEFFPRQRPHLFLDRTTLAAQRAAGYIVDTEPGLNDAAIYPLNQQAVSWLVQELMAWLTGARPLAHTVTHRSDSSTIERISLERLGGGGGEDCPLCGYLLGRCRSEPLAQVQDALRPPLNINPEEPNHGTTQA